MNKVQPVATTMSGTDLLLIVNTIKSLKSLMIVKIISKTIKSLLAIINLFFLVMMNSSTMIKPLLHFMVNISKAIKPFLVVQTMVKPLLLVVAILWATFHLVSVVLEFTLVIGNNLIVVVEPIKEIPSGLFLPPNNKRTGNLK